jgi:hypothetical protein
MLRYLVGVGGLGLVGVGLLLLEPLLQLLLPLPLHLLLPARRGESNIQTSSLRQSINVAVTTGSGKWSTGGVQGLDLDVDALLGALLLAEHAPLPVAEEAPAARRRGGRRGAQARGEGGQRGPHRHLVLSSRTRVESGWDAPALRVLAGWVDSSLKY